MTTNYVPQKIVKIYIQFLDKHRMVQRDRFFPQVKCSKPQHSLRTWYNATYCTYKLIQRKKSKKLTNIIQHLQVLLQVFALSSTPITCNNRCAILLYMQYTTATAILVIASL